MSLIFILIRVNQVQMDPSEHQVWLDYQVRPVKEAQSENQEKQDLQVYLVSLVCLAKLVKKALKVLLDHKANKDLSVHQDCQDSPAKEV